MKINESPENIVALSDIREKKLRASSPYGPVRAGLTTWQGQRTIKGEDEARLTELLSSLENEVESLKYKSFTAYDMLNVAIEDLRAALSDGIDDTIGIDGAML